MTQISKLLRIVGLAISAISVLIAAGLALQKNLPAAFAQALPIEPTATGAPEPIQLPPLSPVSSAPESIYRKLALKTNIPERTSYKVARYTVQNGDSPWSIAQQFELRPESVLWANEELNANAGSLKPGMLLNIPPVDGVLHTVQQGDTLESIEIMHGTPVREIFEFPGNEFDLTQAPDLEAGRQIIVPNGISPIVWQAGPNLAVVSGNSSSSVPLVMSGTGFFIWPLAPPIVLTQPFWGGHLGIDIDTYSRQPVFASDSGTVIYSGWDDTGYGNFIIIDHANGYKTTYGHNEANLVSTGQGVVKGQQIAESGNTGNSTGDHLDFRILYNGVALDPQGFLP